MLTHLPLFLTTTWLLAMLPGAGQALLIRQALEGGKRVAGATILGNATGLVLWSAAATAGLSTLLLANPRIYTALQIAGGIVLFLIGSSTLVSALRTPLERVTPSDNSGDTDRSELLSGYTAGLGTNLGNPKAGVFAVSILPQFMTAQGPALVSGIALGLLWALVTASWNFLLTWAVARGQSLISRPAVYRGVRLATGVVLLFLGVTVAIGL
ncbi:LysE family translocator [Streptomyces oceani]|uniref:Lysine transporter LysE n=1 Tax=Streptomyces oceani TaxID=1075402 RepID=A0A1E7JZI3_9ACTN|nr:LysE family translocator [Streptomyces oceani]OEU97006.1 hypothetical protein AN216_17210 [Streptomyces oceani]